MNKSILASLLAIIAIVLTSCSSDPVGTWVPNDSTTGNTFLKINPDGTAEISYDAPNGIAKVEGDWTKDKSEKNTIRVNLSPNSVIVKLNNPRAAYFIKKGLIDCCKDPIILTISDDGETLFEKKNSRSYTKR